MDRKQSETWQSRAARTVNSVTCFSLAYVLLTYMLWYASGLAGRLYKFDALVYYYGIKFFLNGHGWAKGKIVVVYSAGVAAVFFIALLGLFLYRNLRNIRTLFNVFFLWVFVIGFSIALSQIIIASLGIYDYDSAYYQGLAVTFSWLKVRPSVVYGLNAIVIIFILFAGINVSRPFLAFSYSFSKVANLDRRRRFFFEIAIAPFIIGTLITWVAVFPKDASGRDVLALLASTHAIYIAVIAIILSIGWLSLSYIEVTKQDLVRYNSLQLPNVLFIVLMFASWAYIFVTLRGVYVTG